MIPLQVQLLERHIFELEKESGENMCENAKCELQTKIVELEKILTEPTKDFDDVKLELLNRTSKFEAYYKKLENMKVVLERQLARKSAIKSGGGGYSSGGEFEGKWMTNPRGLNPPPHKLKPSKAFPFQEVGAATSELFAPSRNRTWDLTPFSVILNRQEVQLLLFTDDVLILGKWSSSNIHGVNSDDVRNLASLTGYKSQPFPFIYLGLPVGMNMSRLKGWDPILAKLKNRLSKWKASILSIGDRSTLVSSVLGALGIYYLSLFLMPVTIANSLEAMRDKFFWGYTDKERKMKWIEWKSVLASKKYRDSDPDCFVRDRWINGSWSWSWSRPITGGSLISQLQAIYDLLNSSYISENSHDVWEWSIDDTNSFPVKGQHNGLKSFARSPSNTLESKQESLYVVGPHPPVINSFAAIFEWVDDL
ncbi:hypothetical protein Tco_1447572 [Tanacetum coccineum]